ncbi:prolyl oligopeptidase family serine peptidase [Actinacidiphila bryophytorum]|uniref:Dipeptidyl aminopeptidase/acylaminoacyl peptidase n=1 Tax=Actinacidiphila bryophytorum TaxID=1436133 RepID=A0A9W4MFX4_9ACTN|nr:prolyl oligopeptidase family serine peptidase [Actinacidiphila bryophytorum]MBM9439595.1 S9 family peptidase [Actinacidiphila bryophytorum]MBN6544340.1 S9 family peptidase [Actinacidiphila bryophytorum]CAG7653378.1 Dipeptidyl aminopeptidase/acylaminoacyl peptidase [Actinacidiphila bryophytorum]
MTATAQRDTGYGSWASPIDAATAAAHDGSPDSIGIVGDDVWWTAPRPAEGGRRALVRRRPDGTEECPLPAPWNVRNRVMEYGGTPWAGALVDGTPLIVFTHHLDQRLYAFRPDRPQEQPYPLTPVSAVGGGLRWAQPSLHADRGEAWAVLEEFTGEGPGDLRRVHAAVPLDGSAAGDRSRIRDMAPSAHRFVTALRPSPDGSQAVWLAWDHPRMPWDGTELLCADLRADGTLGPARTLIGGPEESVSQAEWTADGTLLAATDRTGWWNLHRVDPATGEAVNLCPREEEFAGPLWKLGQRWFAPLDHGLVAVLHGAGAARLGLLDPATGQLTDAPGHWTEWSGTLAATGSRVIGLAASARSSHEIVELDAATGRTRVIGNPHHDPVDPAYVPQAQDRVFTGPGGREVHAHVYPPRHPGHPASGPAPYVMWVHGGPTSRTSMVLDLEIAYFTSRGIGVAEVNYGGSTGYGRAYRNRLREQWGVVDVEDSVAVAEGLVAEGAADPQRLAIRGGSAGGWTTAAALTTTSTFACGAISYPILDLAGWSPAGGETHDFESWYLESLIGPHLEVPQRYHDRSPVHHADQVTVPFLLMQGLDDVICPPAQCERFLAQLAGRDLPHAYLAFPGESHGFRRLDTLVTCLEAELSLYAQVFGFTPPGVPVLDLAP